MATNLDAHCAQCAHNIVALSGANRDKDLENRLNNALGVLQEDGFYAFYLFLKYRKLNQESRGGDDKAWPVWPKLAELLQSEVVGAPLPQGNDDDAVIQMTEDLRKLLLAKQLTERTLVYARYGLRSLPGG
jgi:hypothetical protein